MSLLKSPLLTTTKGIAGQEMTDDVIKSDDKD